ncbi:MAG: hypothetical protein KF716_19940 [Anaerolineae bacterium]|nr:hypothetical protein [Anaerolineae bacterium]
MKALATNRRQWDVLLIGGASGSGKTSVSYRLAQHFGVGITEIDDFQVILKRLTTPEQFPALHYWDTHPDAYLMPPEEMIKIGIAICHEMLPALEAVIDNHIESNVPIVLEGDFLLPALSAKLVATDPAKYAHVQIMFIYEPSEAQILSNYACREPESPPQTYRARVSWLYGELIKQQAEQYGLSVVPSRPWDTLFDRLLALLTV